MNLTIDRQAAARFGIMPADIDNALYNLIGQREVAQYFTQLNAYHVVVEAPPALQADPGLFNSVFILSPITGKTVPLSMFVKVDPNGTSSLTVSHQGQFPAATFSFNLAPGVSLGQATQLVEKARRQAQSAADAHRHLPGHRPGLPAVALQRAAADRRGADRRLCDPGHPLRELHPPPDDPLDPAVRRRGRDPGAAARRPGPERHRHHRHHPAHRHREEERHHDRRRGAAAGARAWHERHRRGPRGLAPAAAPDPDDHRRGHAGRRADDHLLTAPARSSATRWATPSSAACWSPRCSPCSPPR